MEKIEEKTGAVACAADILGIEDAIVQAVEVPEWGGKTVFVRSMSGKDRDAFEMAHVQLKDDARVNYRARLLVLAITDADGKRIFDDRPETVEALGKKNAAALGRLWKVAAKLNGMLDEEQENIRKNSGSDQSAASGSDSASPSASPPSSEPSS